MRLRLVEDDVPEEGAPAEAEEEVAEEPLDDKAAKAAFQKLSVADRVKKYAETFGEPTRSKGEDVQHYITYVFGSGLKFEGTLADSIKVYGFSRDTNKFLDFVVRLFEAAEGKKIMGALTNELASLIQADLQDRVLSPTTDPGSKWLFDSKAYSSKYKLQSLLTLSDEDDIEDYMDWESAKNLIPTIVGLGNDKAIADALDNAQTRHGEGRYKYSTEPVGGSEEAVTKMKNKLFNFFKDYKGQSEAVVKKAIDKVFDAKKNEGALIQAVINELCKVAGVDPSAEPDGAKAETPKK